MVKPQPKAKKKDDTPPPSQHQVCAVLAGREGSWPRDDLRAALPDLDDRQFQNAVYNATKAKRVRRNGDAFEITKAGISWITSEQLFSKPPARPKVKPTKVAPIKRGATKAPKRQKTAVSSSPPKKDVDRTSWPLIEITSALPFRCAVFSDRSFVLEKGGVSITLNGEEYAQMRQHQESFA